VVNDPYFWEELKGPLKGLRSCKFSFKGTRYRLAYRVDKADRVIEIALVGPRQNFYEMLRRIIQR
jgi:mRNA-degrading endonuclease RelE of RelBE toxin-antitoxin system